MVAYESTSFWSGDTTPTILVFLVILVCACLPAAAAFRTQDKKLGAGYLALGFFGAFLYIPWIPAMFSAGRRIPFRSKKDSVFSSQSWKLFSGALLIFGIILFGIACLSLRRSMLSFGTERLYLETVSFFSRQLNGIFCAALIIVAAGVTLISSRFQQCGFWRWYLTLPFLLSETSLALENYDTGFRIVGYVLCLGTAIFVWINTFLSAGADEPVSMAESSNRAASANFTTRNAGGPASIYSAASGSRSAPSAPSAASYDRSHSAASGSRSAPSAPSAASYDRNHSVASGGRTAPSVTSRSVDGRSTEPAARKPASPRATGTIICLSGQYAGAEFQMQDGDTLCFGSDPALAHLIFESCQAAPLHLEIVFQANPGNYLLVHRSDHPVTIYGAPAQEVCSLSAGTKFSFGSPLQTFQLL